MIQILQLDPQDGSLQLVQARIAPRQIANITLLPTVLPEHTYLACKAIIVCHHQPGVPDCTQILGRVTAEAADMSNAAQPPPLPFRAMRLGTILDQYQSMPLTKLADYVQIGRLAVNVHDKYSTCARCENLLELGRVKRMKILLHINQHRH